MMQSLAKGGYTAAEVIEQLHMAHGSRMVTVRYELLNKDDGYLGDIDRVTGSIAYDSLAEIKRTGRFVIGRPVADAIDWVNERIRTYYRLRMPDGNWIEWPMGILLLSSPTRREGNKGRVEREVEAYDKAQILKEDCFMVRHVVAAGANYVDAATAIINSAGIGKVRIDKSDAVLAAPVEFEPGSSKLEAVNDLLTAINYQSLTFDAMGYAVASPYIEPSARAVDYEYRTNRISVIRQGAAETLDLFGVPNVFVRTVSRPDRDPLVSTYINDNAASPLSTVVRGRKVVDYQEVQDIADQQTLDAYTRRQAINAGQIFGEVSFSTAIMPHHGYLDCLYLEHNGLGISGNYIETSWSMDLAAAAAMTHNARKVVALG